MQPTDATLVDDVATLHAMGYGQELLRRMGAFSNFAIAFSTICIVAGGITSFHLAFCAVGGAGIGLGWGIGCLLSLCFALTMGQIASAFPTAGGIYHWSSILGGRGLGWAAAWFNLVGLITVLAAINVGTYVFALGAFAVPLGLDPASWSPRTALAVQAATVSLITFSQALLNHRGVRLTTKLTDFSGYWILVVAAVLTLAMLVYAPHWEVTRLWTVTNFSGAAGGGVWPESLNTGYLLALGLLLPLYTVTGFDASAHTAEETHHAAATVPRAIVRAVGVSWLAGWVMLAAVVVAIPDMATAAAQGDKAFAWIMAHVLPGPLALGLYAAITLAQYLCGLACLTSASRMIYAFARDGGLPFSYWLRRVSPVHRTPAQAIWTLATLTVAFTIYTPVYATITAVSVVFLYVSYVLPTALGCYAYGRSWTQMGPWQLGTWFQPLAALCVAGCLGLLFIAIQPPNDKAATILVGFVVLLAAVWYGAARATFQGPPMGASLKAREAAIAEAERAVGQAA